MNYAIIKIACKNCRKNSSGWIDILVSIPQAKLLAFSTIKLKEFLVFLC